MSSIFASLEKAGLTNSKVSAKIDQANKNGGRRLLQIGPFFIKYNPDIDVIEGQNMLFIGRQTVIPVPRVYAIYTVSERRSTYVIMEYIEGNTLGSKWGSLSEKLNTYITQQLRRYMKHLRRIPSPEYYCSIGRRGLLARRRWIPRHIRPI